jgi:hypothetical protein
MVFTFAGLSTITRFLLITPQYLRFGAAKKL